MAAFEDRVLHDVRGVKRFELSELGREGWDAIAECGIGRLLISNKPTLPFGRGVVCIHPEIDGKDLCDDPQIIAAYISAFEGYNPFIDEDGARWAELHILPGDREFDWDKSIAGVYPVLPKEEAEAYLVAHSIPHPGTKRYME